MFFTAAGSLARVRAQIAAMRALADQSEERLFATAPFTTWTPSEHIDHNVKVAAAIVGRLLDDGAARGDRGVSAIGRLILAVGRIPRGKGKAPERVFGARQTAAELHASLDKLEAKLALLTDRHLAASRGPIVPHPRFRGLLPAQALRFLAIHTDHHLRIVADILAR